MKARKITDLILQFPAEIRYLTPEPGTVYVFEFKLYRMPPVLYNMPEMVVGYFLKMPLDESYEDWENPFVNGKPVNFLCKYEQILDDYGLHFALTNMRHFLTHNKLL